MGTHVHVKWENQNKIFFFFLSNQNCHKMPKKTKAKGNTKTKSVKGQKVNKNKRDKSKKDPNHVHESKGQSKAIRYLKDWHAHHTGESEEWKFEKCRQIWLLQNAYDSKKICKEDFKVLLKYMKSIQGRAKIGVLEDAQKKVSLHEERRKELTEEVEEEQAEGKSEKKIAEELDHSQLDEDISVKRARKIIKKLSTTTQTSSNEEAEEK